MDKFYDICNRIIKIDSPYFPDAAITHDEFLANVATPDICITVRADDFLPEKARFGSTDNIFRYHPMGTEEGSLTVYDKSNHRSSETFVVKKNMKVTLDERYFWSSISFASIMLQEKILFFHASFIEINGEGIIFTAPSGTGKSTQARLWQEHKGANVINGDKAGILLQDKRAIACGVPFCGTSGICKNRSVPLKAIVLLSQAKQNTVCEINGAAAIAPLMQNVHLDLAAADDRLACIDLLIELLGNTAVLQLGCTPDKSAVDTLAGYLGM